MITGCAQTCLCLSFGASVQAFYLLSKFWAHYSFQQTPEASAVRHKYSMNQASWTLLLSKWLISLWFGVNGRQDFIWSVLFSLTLSYPPRKDGATDLESRQKERKGALSSSFYWKLRCSKNIQKNTVIYPFRKWNDLGTRYQFITWV